MVPLRWIAAFVVSLSCIEALTLNTDLRIPQQGRKTGDWEEAASILRQGNVYVHPKFVSESLLHNLKRDIQRLDGSGYFRASGLTNTAVQGQGFDSGVDRRLCALKFREGFHVEGGYSDDEYTLTKQQQDTLEKGSVHRKQLALKINELRASLSELMGRPDLIRDDLEHEVSYSIYGPGASLKRHLDERHEEFKGNKGWVRKSRRSISWLLYLNDPDWDFDLDGGALRTFIAESSMSTQKPRTIPEQEAGIDDTNHALPVGESVGAHEQNLQVGWLRGEGEAMEPVYMDCWVSSSSDGFSSVLYVVPEDRGSRRLSKSGTRRISNEFDSQNIHGGDGLRAYIEDRDLARRFWPIEDRSAWDSAMNPPYTRVMDILPGPGTLVLFDSVAVPHEVQRVNRRDRLSIAGWFHEATQPFPEFT